MLRKIGTATTIAAVLVAGIALWWVKRKQHQESTGRNDPAVVAYGYGPKPNKHVRYQPDVVLIGDGPHAIRGVSRDELTWTIDANAKGADQLSVGKIMFATSRAVGRVISLQREGDNLVVGLGPVQLTEVIRDARIDIDTILDSKLLAEDQPHTTPSLREVSVRSARKAALRPAVWHASPRGVHLRRIGADLPQVSKNSVKVKVGNWEIEPYFKLKGEKATVFDDSINNEYANNPAQGAEALNEGAKEELRQAEIGVKVLYNAYAAGDDDKGIGDQNVEPPGGQKKSSSLGAAKAGLKFGYSIRMYGQNIRIRSHVDIADGKLDQPATFVIDGIDRMHLGFFGGAENGFGDNVKARIEVPWDRVIPIPINGFPLALHVKFKFLIETAFSGANSTMWAGGDYKIVGAIGIENGNVLTPTIEVLKPMSDNMHGLAVGVSGIVVATEYRILAGLGNSAFVSGVYGKAIFTFASVKGSFLGFYLAGPLSSPLGDASGALGMASRCRGVKIKGDGGGGVGIVIDKTIAPGFKNVKLTELELFEQMKTFYDKEYRVGCPTADH